MIGSGRVVVSLLHVATYHCCTSLNYISNMIARILNGGKIIYNLAVCTNVLTFICWVAVVLQSILWLQDQEIPWLFSTSRQLVKWYCVKGLLIIVSSSVSTESSLHAVILRYHVLVTCFPALCISCLPLTFSLCLKDVEGMANSADSDQTAPRSSLIWVYTVCWDRTVRKLSIITVTCFCDIVPALCNQLTDPDSGSFTLETNRTVTTAVVSCISGYEVFGSLVITCNSDGSWNSVEPTCGRFYNAELLSH